MEVVTVNNPSKRQTLARKYNRQAINIILHHAKTGHVKDFVINESDLRSHVKEELTIKRIGGTPREYYKLVDEIFSNSVRRLFEDLDLVYYHDHLASKLTVRVVP
jgi:predicted RNase H-like nuclease